MSGAARSYFPSLIAILLGIFGVSVALLVLDVLISVSGSDLPHQSSLRIALTYTHVPKTDSWRPMLDALATASGPDGNRLYETLFFERALKFQYPPTSLLYMMPFSGWTLDAAAFVLNILNAIVLIATAATVAAIANIAALRSRLYEMGTWISPPVVIAIAFAASLIFYPLIEAVNLGQIQAWLDLAFALALLSWLTGHRTLAGVLMGFASTIKPQFGLLLLWALLWRDWRFVGGYLALCVPVGLVSVVIFGLHNHLEYLKVLSFISAHGEAYYPNNSVNGIVNRLLGNGSATDFTSEFAPENATVLWATRIAFIAFVAFGLKFALRNILRPGERTSADVIDFGTMGLCAVMGSPVAWEHHYGIALPLFVLAFFSVFAAGRESSRLALGLFLSWSLAANFTKLVSAVTLSPYNILQAHIFIGCLWLVWYLGSVRGEPSTWLEPSNSPHRRSQPAGG